METNVIPKNRNAPLNNPVKLKRLTYLERKITKTLLIASPKINFETSKV